MRLTRTIFLIDVRPWPANKNNFFTDTSLSLPIECFEQNIMRLGIERPESWQKRFLSECTTNIIAAAFIKRVLRLKLP